METIKQTQIETTQQIQAQEESKKKLNEILQELSVNIDNGLIIDREMIDQAYSKFTELLKPFNVDEKEAYLQLIHSILNENYIFNLNEKLIKRKISLPHSMSLVLNKLGFSKETLAAKLEEGSKIFSDQLKKRLSQPDINEGKISILELINLIQDDFIQIALSMLPFKDQAPFFANLFKQLHNFELKIEKNNKKGLEKTKLEIKKMMSDPSYIESGGQNHEKQLYRYLNTLISKNILTVLSEEISTFDFFNLQTKNIEELTQLLDQWNKKIDKSQKLWNEKKFFNLWLDYTSSYLSLLESKQELSWNKANASALKFSFNQGHWGEQEIFGEGVSQAINYRWIKHLMKNPGKPIKDASDLDTVSVNEKSFIQSFSSSSLFQKTLKKNLLYQENAKEESGVSSQDRINHATYKLGVIKDHQVGISIGQAILKRDQLEFQNIEKHTSTIQETIDDLVNHHLETIVAFSQGVIGLGIYVETIEQKQQMLKLGHAIGMQIEPTRNIYRFWDVNSGFYQYETLEKLKIGLQGYMKEYYPEYNHIKTGYYFTNK